MEKKEKGKATNQAESVPAGYGPIAVPPRAAQQRRPMDSAVGCVFHRFSLDLVHKLDETLRHLLELACTVTLLH